MRKLKLLIAACALLVSAGVQAQKDVTSQYITNATLKDGYDIGWTATNFHAGPTQGNNTKGYTVECWNNGSRPTFSLLQNITLPAGSYRLVNYSFYRTGSTYDQDVSNSEAYLKAGNEQVKIKTLGSIEGQQSYANSMAEAANRFDTKMYRNVVEFSIDADNTTIEIGVTGTHTVAASWFICGMFELFDLNDVATVSSPTDMTYAITNPGFEYCNTHGWTNNNGCWYVDGNNNLGAKSGVAYVEKWVNNVAMGSLGSFTQTLQNMPAGLYELSVYARNDEQYNSSAGGKGMFLIANNDKTEIGSLSQYKVRTTLQNDGDLTIGINLDNCTGNWIAFDRFELQFYGDPLKAYQDLLDAAVNTAQALINGDAGSAISATAKAAWQAVVDDNDNDDKAFTEESQFTTAIENINNANTNYQAMAAPYALWKKVKAGADAMALVANNNASATSTLTDAVSTQNTAAEAATTPEALNNAISTLRTAIRTFISATEPTGGASFEITCLVENPSFDDNTIDGWTREITKTGGAAQTSFTCNEFWNNTFNFHQTLANLPNGSYQLSVQAFSRPGGNIVAYPAYKSGTNSVTAELYVNNDASTVGNIYAYTDNTTGAKVTSGSFIDYECVVDGGTNYWVPNGMEGANLYFADENVYKTTVAALVTDGNLTIGFRDETYTADQWTIFDNFRLFYYGSDKSVYYAQYLPQLIAEVEADKSNALYANVTGQELSDLDAALGVDASGFTTEQEYSDAIQDIKDAQTAYRAAVASYDALVAAKAYAALTEITANIGDGVFQYPANTASLWTAYSSAKSAVDGYTVDATSTAAAIQALVDALDEAITNYSACFTLNAPDASKLYKLSLANKGTLTFRTASTEGGYGLPFMAANDNLAQAFQFEAVSGNTYKLKFTDLDGETRYICTRAQYGEGGTGTAGIRTFANDNEKNALIIKIQAATTDNVFYMLNTEANDAKLGAQNSGDFYTVADNSDWSIAEASEASIAINTTTAKWGTTILPFAVASASLPDGVKAYTCADKTNDTELTLVKASSIAANTPYIIEGSWNETLTGWGLGATTTYTEGWLTGVYVAQTAPVGSYVLQKNSAGVGFYKVAEGEGKQPTVGANRCYLTVSDAARAFFLLGEEATAIKTIEVLTSGEAEIYNAAGARVPSLQKGMNIIRKADGQSYKVMVK